MPERDPSLQKGADGTCDTAPFKLLLEPEVPGGDSTSGAREVRAQPTRGLKAVCLYVREDDWAALRQHAAQTGESASSVVRSLIGAYLEAVGE